MAPPSFPDKLDVAVPKDHPSSSTGLHPLLETIANQARSPYINHTLKRTFAPAVDALIGCDIAPPSLAKRRCQQPEEEDELMDTVEREIANIDSRFLVDLDPLHLIGSLDVQLICKMDDKNLPSVPPLRIVVPHNYPQSPPVCPDEQREYGECFHLFCWMMFLLHFSFFNSFRRC